MREQLLFVATWAGPVLSLGMLAPIAWQPIKDRGVAGLSVGGTIVTAVTVQMWLTYGLLIHDPRQIGVNIAVTAVRMAIMVAAIAACRSGRVRAMAVAAIGAGVALAFAGASAVGLTATTLSTLNRTPQAAFTIRNGRGAGLSVVGFTVGVASDLAWMIYGIVFGDIFVFGASLICACFDAVIVLAATRPEHALVAAMRRMLTREPMVADVTAFGVVAGD